MAPPAPSPHMEVLGARGPRFEEILTPAALDLVARLDSAFAKRRLDLLQERHHQSDRLASGSRLDFPRATSAVRDDPNWRVAPPAPGLADRRVEITGPPERGTAVTPSTRAPRCGRPTSRTRRPRSGRTSSGVS